MRRRLAMSWRLGLGVVMAAALMALASRGVDWDDVRRAIAAADFRWLLPAGATIVVGQAVRAARWRALFGDSPKPGFRDAFAILSVGYLLSNVLPLRLGDPMRAWLVETRTPGDGAQALATVVAERAVDLLAIVLLVGAWLPAWGARMLSDTTGIDVPAWLLSGIALLAVTLGAAVLAAASAAGQVVDSAVFGAARRLGVARDRAGRWAAGARRFAEGFSVLRSPRRAVLIFAWSLAVWLVGAVGYWLVFRAFHIALPLSAAAFTVCAAALFAAFLPPAPGYVGTFHAAVSRALVLYGVPVAVGLSYALVLHALTFAMLMVMGGVGLWMLGVSTSTLGARIAGDSAAPEG